MDFLKSMAIAASGLRSAVRAHARDRREHRQRGIDRAAAGRQSVPAQDPDLPLRNRSRARCADHDDGQGAGRTLRNSAPNMSRGIRRPIANGYVKYPERQFAGRNDRHARGAAFLRGEPQRHRRDAPHDPETIDLFAPERAPTNIGETHGVADYRRECLRQACAACRSGRQSGQGDGRRFGRTELRQRW